MARKRIIAVAAAQRTDHRLPILAGTFLILAAMVVFGALAHASQFVPFGQSAASQAATGNTVPQVLSAADTVLYRRIFDLQEDGKWSRADREIKRLRNPILMGHVLYQRYMHPTKYRSKYEELHLWLKKYADLPGASRVYALAVKRHIQGWKQPAKPKRGYISGNGDSEGRVFVAPFKAKKHRSAAQNRQVRGLQRQMRRLIRHGRPTAAYTILKRKSVKRLFNRVEYDEARWWIAAGYFFAGKDHEAYELAAASAARSRTYVEIADWTAGLAAWRLGDMDAAKAHFEELARSTSASSWNIAAGAYWAARVQLVTKKPQNVTEMLNIAAQYPRTFYGLLSARLLARDLDFTWSMPALDPAARDRILHLPAVQRAIALQQVGRSDLAEQEIRKLYPRADRQTQAGLVVLAQQIDLPAASMRLGVDMRDRLGKHVDSALYPVPQWEPEGGYQVDRALVFAFMRRESGFNPEAKSHVGARGLMQLMPRTASFVAGDKSLRGKNRSKLYDPTYNISLGQQYLSYLLNYEGVNNNLFLLAAAYNGGPGNLRKWLHNMKNRQDPLMFIESIPALETRIFIEKVLTNFWIYRIRLDQDVPSLDAIAAGNWPYYLSLDSKTITVAQHVEN